MYVSVTSRENAPLKSFAYRSYDHTRAICYVSSMKGVHFGKRLLDPTKRASKPVEYRAVRDPHSLSRVSTVLLGLKWALDIPNRKNGGAYYTQQKYSKFRIFSGC